MNPRRLFPLVAVAALLLSCGDETGPPETLSVSDPFTLLGGGRILADSMVVRIGYTDEDGEQLQTLFDDVAIGADDANVILAVDGGPEFDAFRAMMTNGVDENIGLGRFFHPGGGGGINRFLESDLFLGHSGSGPDLTGFGIDRVEFHVDTLILESPGSDPNGDGIWTTYSLTGRLVVIGRR